MTARAHIDELDRFCRRVLQAVGVDEDGVDAATRVMIHANRLAIDSHGVRLLEHYVKEFEGGRIAKRPKVTVERSFGALATVDAANAHGAVGTFRAATVASELAREFGIGAVGVRNSAHFGAAGAYALQIANEGMIGYATCNSGSVVALYDGAEKFHGTNPHAWAVPVAGQDPWLLDMATSAIPLNRVFLHRSTGEPLLDDCAANEAGETTLDPNEAEMLKPLGAAFGYKGAGLAGLADILSAVLTGMNTSPQIMSFTGPDFSTPRGLGAFVLALKPDAFVSRDEFDAQMAQYVEALRQSKPRAGGKVMAPGDREWAARHTRERDGVPLDPATLAAFATLCERYSVAPLTMAAPSQDG